MKAGWARRISYLVLAALVFVTSCRAWSHADDTQFLRSPAPSTQIMESR